MQIEKLFISIIFMAVNIFSYGQCPICVDSSNDIINNGNGTFTSSIAQGYYWEICEGNATISGSNTLQTVTLADTGSGESKIKVSRFNNGACADACETISACDSCSDTSNIITNNGDGTFAAANAQGYYWEICEGNASILGSNTSQTIEIEISGSVGNFKIKVFRFVYGSCSEACEILNNFYADPCQSAVCPSDSDLNFLLERGGGKCSGFVANVTALNDCIDYVDWTWNACCGAGAGAASNGSTILAVDDLTNPSTISPPPLIYISATVVYQNGTTCPTVGKHFHLDCGDDGSNPEIIATNIMLETEVITEQPTTENGYFSIRGATQDYSISILDSFGQIFQTIDTSNNDDIIIDLSNLPNGIYLLSIENLIYLDVKFQNIVKM